MARLGKAQAHQHQHAARGKRYALGTDSHSAKSSPLGEVAQINVAACGGWPRTQELGSVQFQAATRIQTALGELATEASATLITWADALELIDWALDQTFAPQRQASNIQLLGMLETTGLSFDYLWVCGMSAEQFPGKAAVSAFIPCSAAVTYGLSRSTQAQTGLCPKNA